MEALPELAADILTPDSASLVDVIHTNGALEPCVVCDTPRCGALPPLGHLDFYPSGGSVQPGCVFGGILNICNKLFLWLQRNHLIWLKRSTV